MKRKRARKLAVCGFGEIAGFAETSAYGSFVIGTGSHARLRKKEIPRSKVEEKMGRAGIVPQRRGRRPKPECMRNQRINDANESGMSRIFASWNQLDRWLRQVEGLRRVA